MRRDHFSLAEELCVKPQSSAHTLPPRKESALIYSAICFFLCSSGERFLRIVPTAGQWRHGSLCISPGVSLALRAEGYTYGNS